MLIPSNFKDAVAEVASLSRRVNANSQPLKSGQPLQFQAYQEG